MQPSGGASTGSGTQADLESAARASFVAFLTGDDQAYFGALSSACREALGYSAVESYLSGRRFNAVNVGNIDLSQVAVGSVEITSFDGSSAQVALVVTGTSEEFKESRRHRWAVEDGAWRLADCGGIRESPNSFEGRGTDPNDPLRLGDIVDIGAWYVSLAYVEQDYESVMGEGEVEPAGEGNQLVGAQVLVGYDGPEQSVVIGDFLAFAMVSGTTVYGDEASCVSLEFDDLFYDPTMEASPGEDLPRPLICREVPASVAGSMLLRATDVNTGTEYWFDLSET